MSNQQNIFEQATRQQLRFETRQGALTTEQIWTLDLTSPRASVLTLDEVARSVYRDLKEEDGEVVSFVSESSNSRSKRHRELELQLDILKHIIAVKKVEKDLATQRAANRAEAARLKDELAKRAEDRVGTMSEEDIKKRLADLTETTE